MDKIVELQALDDRRHDAIMSWDKPALDEIFSDDVVFVHTSGKKEGKVAFLSDGVGARPKIVSMTREDTRIDVDGDVGIISGPISLRIAPAGQAGADIIEVNVFVTRVALHRAGHWRFTLYQSTAIQGGPAAS
jgi:ketosteroid isomerase-like protein